MTTPHETPPPHPAPGPGTAAPNEMHAAGERVERALFEMKKVIVGQDRSIERILICLLARGHCLVEGVPGLAKTLTVQTLATVVGGTFARIQFTPDLLPADITGTRIYRSSTESFDVELGPVFVNFLLADEVNRAPAKVQSALLEVMAEHQVTIGGISHQVPEPFVVLATQNPIESEGVYPLPEAQRDRFMMNVVVDYPTADQEREIVHRMGVKAPQAHRVLTVADLVSLQAATDAVYVDHAVVDYAVSLVVATRNPGDHHLGELAGLIAFGASPRATLALVAGARALALLRGRSYALPQDVFDIAPEVLRHRLSLTYEALAQGITIDQVLVRILSTIPAARVTPRQDPADPNLTAPPQPNPATDPPNGDQPAFTPPSATPQPAPPPPTDLQGWQEPNKF